MTHTTDAGAPCAAHAPRVEDLVAPAALGVSCFAGLHDLASALQGISAATDELDYAVGTNPELRPLVDALVQANERATALFVAQRAIIRDPGKRKETVDVATLINRASHQAAHKFALGPIAPGTVDVAVPIIAQVIAAFADATTVSGAASHVAAVADADAVVITATAPSPAPAPATIGATLAIAARAAETHAGTVRCGERDGRAAYSLRLPFRPRG